MLVGAVFMMVQGVQAQEMMPQTVGSLGAGSVSGISMVSEVESVNPAGASMVDVLSMVVGGVLPYGFAELKGMSFSAVVPTRLVTVAGRVGESGDSESHFTSFGGGLSRLFGNFGIGIEYYGLVHKLPFGETGRSSFSNVGIVILPAEGWVVSAAVRNVEKRDVEYSSRDVDVPTTFWATLRWKALRYFSLAVELEKSVDENAVGRGAVCLRPAGGFFFTAGFSSNGTQLSAGAGYDWRLFGIRASVSHHSQLGVTSGAALAFHMRRDE